MPPTVERIQDLNREASARLVMDMLHRIIVHYALWFTEVRHQMGHAKALDALLSVSEKSWGLQLKRLSSLLGFGLQDGIPVPLLDLDRETLDRLLDAVAVNWLANDGIWFQAVEFTSGMVDAKRCNDSCWAQFSPFEARAIKKFLDLPEAPGLDGLKTALNFRLYARINTQSIVDEGPESFIFRMDACRVQTARKRKNLPDYPCKSGGVVEYTYFARAIDPRIATECIACPPDAHPDDWYCAWRFRLSGGVHSGQGG